MLETDAEISNQQIAELQSITNITDQELEQLEGAFNTTNETVQGHERDIQSIFLVNSSLPPCDRGQEFSLYNRANRLLKLHF